MGGVVHKREEEYGGTSFVLQLHSHRGSSARALRRSRSGLLWRIHPLPVTRQQLRMNTALPTQDLCETENR